VSTAINLLEKGAAEYVTIIAIYIILHHPIGWRSFNEHLTQLHFHLESMITWWVTADLLLNGSSPKFNTA
jgi:hypothetical protein